MSVIQTLKTAWIATRFFVVKNAPTILTIGGTVATVAGTFFACKSTLKLNELMEERDAEREAIEAAHDKGLPGYSDKDYKTDLIKCRTTTVKKLVKLYWKPALCTTLGVASILTGHGMMADRNLKLGIALVSTERAYNGLKERLKKDVGEEKANDIIYPHKEVPVTTVVPDEETGELVNHEDKVNVWEDSHPYSTIWDESSVWCKSDPSMNRSFLKQAQCHWNDVLEIRKPYPVFLNEVREDIGLQKIRIGNVAGWTKGPIDFGIADDPYNKDFIEGREETCRLNFNCEGNVLGDLPEKDWGGDRFLITD